MFTYGFGFIWEDQEDINGAVFIQIFRQRIFDCAMQMWSLQISDISKLCTYKLFKGELKVERYLLLNLPRRLTVIFAKFRISNYDLEIEKGRVGGIEKSKRLCKICKENMINVVENEIHVIFQCPAYTDIREIFLGFGTKM